MRFKKKWRKIAGIAAIMGILLSQLDVLPAVAEESPVKTDEISIERKLKDGTTTKEVGTVSVDEDIILEISDTNETDTFINVPLGDNFIYNEELTTEVNKEHEDATFTYESSENSVHISWSEEDTEHNVSLAITATKASDNTIYAKTIRDNREYHSESIHIKVQDTAESSDDEAIASSDSSSDEFDTGFEGEEPDNSNSETVTESSDDVTADSNDDVEAESSDSKEESMLSPRVAKPSSNGNVTKYSGATVVGNSVVTIDSKYSFYPTYINGVTTATVNGRSISANKEVNLTAADKKSIQQGTFVAEYKGAGYYKGRLVDVVMKVSSDDYTAPSLINLTLNFNGYMMAWRGLYNSTFDINYSFFDNATGEPVSVTGFFTYVDIDCDEWYAVEKDDIKDIYVTSNTKINYSDDDKYFYAIASSSGDLGTENDKFLWFQFTYEDVSEMNISMHGYYSSLPLMNSGLIYSSDSLVKIGLPSPEMIGDEGNSDLTDTVVEYKVIQDMPYRDATLGYPNKVVLTATYETVLKDPTDVKITSSAGTNLASNFDIKVSNGEIIATLKNNKAAIYGDTLIMTYSSTPKEGADLSPYIAGSSYQLPAKAILDDGDTKKESNVAYASLPLTKAVPSVEKSVENLNGGDIYKVGDRVLYTISLKNLNENTAANWSGVELKDIVPSGLTVDTSTFKKVYTKKDGTVVETDLDPDTVWSASTNLLDLKQSNIYGTEEVKVTFEAVIGNDLANSTVTNTVEVTSNDFDAISDDAAFTTEGELEFVSAPNIMNFGNNLEISSKEEVYQLDSNDKELVVQDFRGTGSTWSMTAKLITELTSESGYELLDSLYYMSNGQEQAFSTDSSILIYDTVTESSNPVIISNNWGGSDDAIAGPFLKVKPGQARSESYSGKIQWTLQDVPGNS